MRKVTAYTGLKITSESTFNEIGQLTSTIAPNGLVTQYNYNYLGRQTSTVVDPTGSAITSSVIYDNNGNTIQTTDAGGLVVTVVYDALSRQGTQTVDPGGKNIISKVFYNRDGSVDKTINPEGVVTKNIYNSLGHRTSTIVDQGVTNITTQFEYNLAGNITIITDPLTKVATRGYDALHRTIASTDAKGNISRVDYDNLNRPIISTDALGVQTVTNYNLLNQVTSQTIDPTGLNQTTSMLYDSLGRTTTITKANGIQEVFEYDLADRKTKTIQDPTGLNIITQYEFNNLSQMTKVIDAKNKATQYAYNTLGQLTTETYADAGVKSYTYNSLGQRIAQTDQNNNQFGYLYDNLYRLTTVNVTPGSGVGGTTQQVFTYDNLSRLTNAKDITSSYTNEVQRTYNTLGRLTTETQKIGTSTDRTISKEYNLVGRVTQLTYPNGRVNTYSFDNNHLPNTIVSNSTTVATYQFNAVNAPVTKTLGNNVSLNIEYNNRYQIKKHDWKLNGNTITGFNYGHDSVGNRLYSENLVTANKSEHFAFDNADRLTSFKTGTLNGSKTAITTPTYTQDWTLDSIGNWAGFTDNGTSSTNIFSDTHEMTQFKGITNTFDNNGNLTSDGVRTFKYDAFNRIIEVKVGVVVLAEYQYDAFNRRVMKKVDADLNSSFETTVKFLYDGFRCIEELNASDVLTKEYVYGSLYIDEVILQRTGATDYYFTHDYRYSVTSLTNSAGSIVESYDYKVYGERTITGSGLTDIGYTGQRHDSETGLMYFKNRYYSPDRGSFVTMDPLGFVDGMSRSLGYFGSKGVDPFGFWTESGLLKSYSAFGVQENLTLLKIVAPEENGGLGYKIVKKDMKCHDWYVDKGNKIIYIDNKSWNLFERSDSNAADQLKEAIGQTFLGKDSNLWRITKGIGKTAIGGLETVVGAVGIITPEPATTVAGVVLVGTGLSTMGEGISQVFNANNGEGYNFLEEGAAAAGGAIARLTNSSSEDGENVARISYTLSSLLIGNVAAIKILKVPNMPLVATNLGGMEGGIAIGRLQGGYKGSNGFTVLSIVNNSGQSFLRFNFKEGKLIGSIGRIVGEEVLFRHSTDGVEIMNGLIKLFAYGAKKGL